MARTTNNLEEKIIGVWEDRGTQISTYEFHKGGKYKITVSTKEGAALFSLEGTFTVQGNIVTVKGAELTQEVAVKSVSENEMVIQPLKTSPELNHLRRVK